MGFEELSQTSVRNNRSLLRSTIDKYFLTAKILPIKDKTELSVSRKTRADIKRKAGITAFYLVLIFCLIVMIAFLTYFL